MNAKLEATFHLHFKHVREMLPFLRIPVDDDGADMRWTLDCHLFLPEMRSSFTFPRALPFEFTRRGASTVSILKPL